MFCGTLKWGVRLECYIEKITVNLSPPPSGSRKFFATLINLLLPPYHETMPPSRSARFPQDTTRYPLRTQDLDFLILAGCSCLLTLLYHPAIEQIQGGSKVASSSTSNSAPTSVASHGVYNAVEPKRQSFRIEEDEA